MNLRKGELIGKDVTIVRATDPSQVGVTGRIVDETRQTFVVAVGDREKRIPKRGARFRFEPEGTEVEGDVLLYRPEDRIKKAR